MRSDAVKTVIFPITPAYFPAIHDARYFCSQKCSFVGLTDVEALIDQLSCAVRDLEVLLVELETGRFVSSFASYILRTTPLSLYIIP